MNIEELAVTLKMLGYNIRLNRKTKSIYLIALEPLIEIEEMLK